MEYIYKPADHTFPVFYKTYMDILEDQPLVDLMNAKTKTLEAFLLSIPEEKADYRYAAGKWTVKQVLIHMLDTEIIFGYRALCIARGETQSLPGFDQDQYVDRAEPEQADLSGLTASLLSFRKAFTEIFRMMSAEALNSTGTANGKSITAKALAYLGTAHSIYHLKILKERYGL